MPSKTSYHLSLTEKVGSIKKSMQLKAYFILNKGKSESEAKMPLDLGHDIINCIALNWAIGRVFIQYLKFI